MARHKRIERKQTTTPHRPEEKIITPNILKEFQLAMDKQAEIVAKTTPQFNFEDGVREAVSRVRKIPADVTILIAVYGYPDRGKTHLIKRLKREFGNLGMEVNGLGGSTRPSDFEFIKRLESLPSSSLELSLSLGPAPKKEEKRVFIFHCGWDRVERSCKTSYGDEQDPNILSEKILNRKIHLNIGIYNPNFISSPFDKLIGDYDFVICNPNSVRKL